MRSTASILHLDLDAFFASVEQRDKPSLRGKPVIVGGVAGRGVVSTASYEARVFGVHSAMRMVDARRLAPHAAVLSGRFRAYHESSRIVMNLLRELSPLVQPLSLDEAYVDLAAGGTDCTNLGALEAMVTELRAELTERTEGLIASVGVGSSKFLAKVASEEAKPNGQFIIPPGHEVEFISPLPVRAVPGVGPATFERLAHLSVRTIGDLQGVDDKELIREVGKSSADWLKRIAYAIDYRGITTFREAKSTSMEDTFAEDIYSREELEKIVQTDAVLLAKSLVKQGLFARTIHLKVRWRDFTTFTRSRTLSGATDRAERIASAAIGLLAGIDVSPGVRLLGLGLSNFEDVAQEPLFDDEDLSPITEQIIQGAPASRSARHTRMAWRPGDDVIHDQHGRGWVWGAGHGVVTVRFETRETDIGPVRSLADDDPQLHHARILPLLWGEEK
ncbi:MAG: DNA polymerase IV [Propionibacteriaceae bacterium]|jgi:DNA polymerase-4|nr:DNA polymerase IV [Propionibacteriaceae bacterium]